MIADTETAVPPEDLARARDALVGPGGSAFSRSFADATKAAPGLSDHRGARLPASWRLLERPDHFTRALLKAFPGLPTSETERLWTLLRNQEADRGASEVLLTRALDPLAGLLTFPPDLLFSPAEQEAIDGAAALVRPTGSPILPAITGIVKVTRWCNLRCSYCHDWSDARSARMPFAIQLQAIRWLLASQARRVNILLHGGEPTLVGFRELLRLLWLQAALRAPGQEVVTRIQSNATRFTSELLRICVQFGITVSVSLDGPPEVHDLTRRDIAGRPTSARVIETIHRLDTAGVLAGVLVVVTPRLIEVGARRLVEFLRDESIATVGLLAMRPKAGSGVAPGESLETTRYCGFLLDVHRWRTALFPPLQVREIDAAAKALAGGCAGTCELQGSCVGAYFAIEPDGRIMHCDKFVGDDRYTLGTVSEDFRAVKDGEPAQRIAREALAMKLRKSSCPWWRYCRGWCPHEGYVAHAVGGAEPACCGLAPLFVGLAANAAPERRSS